MLDESTRPVLDKPFLSNIWNEHEKSILGPCVEAQFVIIKNYELAVHIPVNGKLSVMFKSTKVVESVSHLSSVSVWISIRLK